MLSPIPAALTPQGPPAETAHAPSRAPGAHPFAELLRQRQNKVDTTPTPPAADKSTVEAKDAAEPDDKSPAPAAADGSAMSQQARTKSRNAASASPPRAPKTAAPTPGEATAESAKATDGAASATESKVADPAIGQWFAHLQLQSATRVDAADARGAAAAHMEAVGGNASDVANGGAAVKPDDSRSGPDPRTAATTAPPADHALDPAALASLETAALAAASSGSDRHQGEPVSATAEPGAAAAPLGALSFAPAHLAAVDAPAAIHVPVTTPFTAAGFSQAFGLQVSALASDGVQHAELHLNPADMGPVSVQIRMDGTDARVDFGADAAATRHAIEAGLPELASALRDAGFTLTGGGVSQHSQGRGNDSDGAASHGGHARQGGAVDAAPTGLMARRVALPGGVDLYA